ncbi:MAG: uL14 family ribosomal protein [archaeon]|jgi:large subunit ribosomal protein L14
MKQISANVTRGLQTGSRCFCTDNSGAKEIEIISVIKIKTRRKGVQTAGIASLLNVVIKKGKPTMKKKMERAVVVRVRKEYRRKNGWRVCFEDNAVVLTDPKGFPKGSEIKGCVAKEVGERYPKIAGLASSVI